MKTLTRIDLDLIVSGGCQAPGCTHKTHDKFFLTGRCHPHAGATAMYDSSDGTLLICCQVCSKPIAKIRVASLPD